MTAAKSILKLFVTSFFVFTPIFAISNIANAQTNNAPSKQDIAKVFYQNGEKANSSRDYSAALEYYKKAANLDHVEAMNMIGFYYQNGYGINADYTKAFEWYKKAAALGSSNAMNNIGNLYIDGMGVTKDYAKAIEWLQKAALLNSPAAFNNIGYLYENGGDGEDYSKLGVSADTARMLSGYGVKKDYTKARENYEKALGINPNYSRALFHLGNIYEQGLGVTQDYSIAGAYYIKAVNNGDIDSILRLANFYYDGRGVTQDDTTALNLYETWYGKALNADEKLFYSSRINQLEIKLKAKKDNEDAAAQKAEREAEEQAECRHLSDEMDTISSEQDRLETAIDLRKTAIMLAQQNLSLASSRGAYTGGYAAQLAELQSGYANMVREYNSMVKKRNNLVTKYRDKCE